MNAANFDKAVGEVTQNGGRVFRESDRPMLQELADKLNAQMKRADARVIVTDGAEDDLIVMVVGYDEEEDEVTDEYGFFLSLPYTDEEGTDDRYSLHYAGYPGMNDYTFMSNDLDLVAAAIETLDLL